MNHSRQNNKNWYQRNDKLLVRSIANNGLKMIGNIRATSKTEWRFSMNFISFFQIVDVSGEKLSLEGEKVVDVRTLFNKRYLFGN